MRVRLPVLLALREVPSQHYIPFTDTPRSICSIGSRCNAKRLPCQAALNVPVSGSHNKLCLVNGRPSYALLDISACAAEHAAVVEAAARAAAAAADKHEGNKCALVDAGLGDAVVAALDGPAGQRMSAVVAACAALRSPATADDARPVTSRSGLSDQALFRDTTQSSIAECL